MIEEEDCDDLPSITIHSSANCSSSFTMPSAEELASQRARELACELELEQLRQRACADELSAAPLRHCDSSGSSASSGSDGELALAAAVTALSVRTPPAPSAHAAAALWAALAPRLAPPAPDLLHLLRAAPPAPRAHLARAVAGVAAALGGEPREWPDDEMLCSCALLCVAVLAQESRNRRIAARALHALLDDHATTAQVSELGRVLLASFPDARTRLQLSDALRSGGDAGADRAAAALTAAALLALLQAPPAAAAEGVQGVARAAAAWRRCAAAERYTCVQLAGRLLAATVAAPAERTARARLLAQLAPPPTAASDAQRPDRLKVLVGTSKLRLLFSALTSTDISDTPY